MKIEFVERNYDIGKKLRELITSKLEKLNKYFSNGAKARVVCKLENKTYKTELTITQKNALYRAEAVGENMYANIDEVLPKIEKQAVRYNRRKQVNVKNTKKIPFVYITEEPETLPEIFKKKAFDLEKITADEAKEQLEMLGHNFYIFVNAETEKVNVIYRRNDGKYGLIEANY